MKVLITRPQAQAGGFASALRAAGFEPVFFPVIEIQPIENNLPLDPEYRNPKLAPMAPIRGTKSIPAPGRYCPPTSPR